MKKINVISGFYLNFVRNKIFGWIICFLLIIIFQFILFPYLLFLQEKNSFLYDRLSHLNSFLYTKSDLNREAPIVFLGDSQILSGIHPQELEIKIGRPIWFLPRPSEQPEGMLLRWKEYERKIKTKPYLVIVNGSVFSVADMDVASAHRSLELNYDSFHSEIFIKKIFRNFYLKNVSSGLYYLLGRIFPFLRLNASVSTTLKIIGEGDEFSYSEKKIDSLLSGNPIEKWRFNLNKNKFIEMEYSKNKGYLDWGKELPYDGVCVPNENPIPLPPNAEAALHKTRVSSLNAWEELFSYLKSQKIPILAISIPFRPDFEKEISTLILMSLWESILMKEKISYWKVERSLFEQSDFGDYTHLNTCGMKKFVPKLAEKIFNLN
ncbi:hypothetical protein LEP1GSC018_2493 [Leptospira kirschneri str. 2008720114]|uniref:hypothetical protein n=1 Tax=Leptospira kirschneri TaxID=29507 RepID=UPI00029752FD|nr:hypothetical protein [Leptospira kirschneri]EKP04572.1 hypothetical protein LEP1GSC018_2493 [Leptospira kirschneri str. 2008720114]